MWQPMHNPGSIPLSASLRGEPAQVINNKQRKVRLSLFSQNFMSSPLLTEGLAFSVGKIILMLEVCAE